MKTIIKIFSILILFTSCEDVIDIELDSIEPTLVVDGYISDENNNCVIRLSQTADYFESNTYPEVSDATVFVSDQSGTKTSFQETKPGEYVSNNLVGQENTTYTLSVIAEGKEYQATVTMPEKVTIGTLSFQETPPYMQSSGGYLVLCNFHDPVGLENYYRMKVYNIN